MTPLEVLGWVGSALLILSVMQARVIRFRALNLVACVVLVVFNAGIEVWSMVAMNLALAAINIFFLARLLSSRHDETAFAVLEVSPHDGYLRHLLALHAEDIAAHQPDFAPDPDDPRLRSYLVLHGDAAVGMVFLHDDGDGTGDVLLDYVTPSYRDFTPGEFLWRRGALLRDAGLHRVRTPEAMVAPYYGRLGFHREDGSYVLDL